MKLQSNSQPTKSKQKMNRRDLAALLSSLISQLILLFLLFPHNSISSTQQQQPLFSLIHNFLSISQTATFISLSRKRKRTHHPFHQPHPDSFKQFFNMKSSTFEWLCGLLEPLLECRDPTDSPLNLPASTRLRIGLFRLSTGAHYHEISTRFWVSENDAKFCAKHLCRVLCNNFRFWVGFPSHTELESVSDRFEKVTGLPNCCGILSCCRFDGIDTDSIAAQIVVDSSSRILSVAAGFSGDKSDLEILNSSNLCKDVEKGVLLNNSLGSVKVNGVDVPRYFLGSGGDYVLLPWLMLPYDNPETGSVEENFNTVHRFMRVSSLKAMASLRNWGVLSRPIKGERKVAVACIGACSILHNMLIDREDYTPFCEDFDDKELSDRIGVGLDANMVEGRAAVIRDALATKAKKDTMG